MHMMQDILESRTDSGHEMLRAMLSAMQDAVIVIDERGIVELVNPAAEKTFGFAAEELVGHNISVLMPSPYREHHDEYLAHYLRTGERHVLGASRELVAQRKDGTSFPVELAVTEMTVGGLRKFTGVVRDISERKRAEEALQRRKQDLDLALDGADVHLWHLDCHSRAMHCFARLPQALGLKPEDVRPELEFWISLLHPDDRADIMQCLADVGHAPPGPMDKEIRLRGSDGEWKWMFVRAQVVERDSAGAPLRVAGSCLDITRRKEAEEKMLLLAQHDALTGLPSRALAYALGERVLASARRDGLRSAVLFVDLDRFKPINDTYGHEAGDAVLQEVARRLTGCIRAEDVAGRIGGDEFMIVLADVDGAHGAARVASQCIASIVRPYAYKALELHLSSSIGISLFPGDGEDIDTLLKHADAAMYHAKECGRENFQFFTNELNVRAANAHNLERRMRCGLRQHQFKLYYQPIVDIDADRVIGAEALLRWPDSGVAPEQFIAVAECTGLINQLGEWALGEACRQQRDWHSNGLGDITISVNVSPVQFRQPGFRCMVSRIVTECGIDPGWLQLEIAENIVLQNFAAVLDTLRALRQFGTHILLDDFGKGYSNLSYLKQLPVDAIKIDRDVVRNLDTDRGDRAIAAAIINLGRELGLQVIAEGIESEATLQSLHARRCGAIQGFHVCHPLPTADFENWYRIHAQHVLM